MKKLISLLGILLNAAIVFPQTNNIIYSEIPGIIGYSAIAYTSQGNPLANQNISLRASILKGSITGSVEYQETHSVDTRDDGYFEIGIGDGTWTSGNYMTLSDIPWDADKYFLKMEIDVSGGYNFGEAGTEAFCSVPYAFHASVADSIPGIDPDSLRMAAGAVGICPCTLQEAYDNGSSININLNNTTSNGVKINNSNYAGTSLFSEVTNASGFPGYFRVLNLNNTSYALGAETNGSNNALRLLSLNTGNAVPVLNISQLGTGSAIQTSNSNINTTNPAILSFQRGKADGGLFNIIGPNSTVSGIAAVRAEVQTGFTPANILTGAGIFHISEPLNTAPVLFAENKGSGPAGIFHLYSTNGLAQTNAVEIMNSCSGNVNGGSTHALYANRTGLGPGSAGFFTNSNPSNTFANYTMQIDHQGCGGNLYLWKWANSNTMAALNGTSVLSIDNVGYGGACIQMQNVQPTNTSPAFYCLNASKGTTGIFHGGPSSAMNPLSDIVDVMGSGDYFNRGLYVRLISPTSVSTGLEIASSGKGTSLRAYTTSLLASGKYVAHFTTNNTTSNASTVFVESNAIAPSFYSIKTGQGIGALFRSTSPLYSIMNYNTGNGPGFFSFSNAQVGITALSNAVNNSALYAAISSANVLTAYAAKFYGTVNFVGNIFQYGIPKSGQAMVKNQNGEIKALAAEETTGEWVSDINTSQLSNGIVTINMDPEYLSTVNTAQYSYVVFVQPEGDCNGLYVYNKTATTFEVRELQGGTSNINFSYKVSAKRKGYETLHLATEAQVKQATWQHLQAVWPELITEADNKYNQDVDYLGNNFDLNHVVTTPTPDTPAEPPALTPPSSSSSNSQTLQQSNPYIQDVDPNPPPH